LHVIIEIKKFVNDIKISTFVPEMKKRFTYKKIFFASMLLLAVELTFGAITTGKTDDSKNKYSLRNLNSSNRRFYSLSTFNTNSFHYTGSLNIYQKNTTSQLRVQSMIRMERGNTTYVYPYKYTVKVPKFKTPTPPSVR
jgi:hypothetical protein